MEPTGAVMTQHGTAEEELLGPVCQGTDHGAKGRMVCEVDVVRVCVGFGEDVDFLVCVGGEVTAAYAEAGTVGGVVYSVGDGSVGFG